MLPLDWFFEHLRSATHRHSYLNYTGYLLSLVLILRLLLTGRRFSDRRFIKWTRFCRDSQLA